MNSRLLCVAALGTLALAGCASTSPNSGYGSLSPSGNTYPQTPTCVA